jgi:zinc transporter ZupT
MAVRAGSLPRATPITRKEGLAVAIGIGLQNMPEGLVVAIALREFTLGNGDRGWCNVICHRR